jgi:hypothetical protein
LNRRHRLARSAQVANGGDYGDDDTSPEQGRDEGNEEHAFHCDPRMSAADEG